jgi:hypothetical protein
MIHHSQNDQVLYLFYVSIIYIIFNVTGNLFPVIII